MRFASNLDTYVSLLLGLPKTLWLNFHCLPWRVALKLPILVSHRVQLQHIAGKICLQSPPRFGLVRIGFGDVGIFDKHRSRTLFDNRGSITFRGSANIGHGSKLCVWGDLTLGHNFMISAESTLVCRHRVTIGDDCLFSWQILLMDTDWHRIKDSSGQVLNPDRPITLGNRVWVGRGCTVLKGTEIGNNVVVAAGSTILGQVAGNDQVIGGQPTKVLKSGITWEL